MRWATVATIDMGQKLGGGVCALFSGVAGLGHHWTQSRLGRGQPPYQVGS